MRVSTPLSVLLFVVIIGAAVGAQADRGPKSLIEDAKKCEQALPLDSPSQIDRVDWVACINAYKLVVRLFPRSPLGGESLYLAGRLLEKASSALGRREYLLDALNSYRQVFYYYPSSRLADAAAYAAGEIYRRKLKDWERARSAYAVVFERYPESPLREKAASMIRQTEAHLPSPRPGESRKGTSSRLKRVENIRYWSNPRYTRVVIDLSEPARYSKGTLRNPDRLYIDVMGSEVVPALLKRSLVMNDGLLKRVRVGRHRRGVTRVVLEVENVRRYKVFTLDDPSRIVIDVKGAAVMEAGNQRRVRSAAKNGETGSLDNLSLTRQLGLSAKRVVLDPGHGGKDPGAIGGSGLEEKEVTLDVAKRLKVLIEKKTEKEVFLTRDRDIYLPLEERTAIANTREADLFVSIHVNAAPRKRASGVETYFLNLATTDEARATAARENQTSLKKISDLQSILQELLLTSKMDESRLLARRVQSAIVRGLSERRVKVNDLGVKQAPFYVLIGAQMPSILVEIAFISNPREEKRLAQPKYRQMLAEAIFAGLQDYMNTVQVAARPTP